MTGFACCINVPGDGTAAADTAIEDAFHPRRALELERDIAVFCGFDHVTAGDAGWLAVRFFVAAEHDRDLSLLQNACGLHGLQREEHIDEAALHVVDAGAGADIALTL